jgi:peptide chain release factor 1
MTDDTILERLVAIERRYDELTQQLADPAVYSDSQLLSRYGREQAELQPVVSALHELRRIDEDIDLFTAMTEDGLDEQALEEARVELRAARERRSTCYDRARQLLLPRDPNDDKDVIVEVRAGTGGEEAALFAAELFRMYARHAERHRWSIELLTMSESASGGIKEAIFEVHGKGAFSRLKYESGGHRVQRVPVTESSGRLHTSMATVAVMPEVEDVDVQINEQDIRVDVFRSSGHGGQSVNTTDSAVRITHLPTGLVVTCQDGKSQLKNKEKALSVLRARLFDIEEQKRLKEIGSQRKMLIGSGDRNERVRTYNFPQDRLSDERLDVNYHNLPAVMDGDIDDLLDALATADRAERLAAGA